MTAQTSTHRVPTGSESSIPRESPKLSPSGGAPETPKTKPAAKTSSASVWEKHYSYRLFATDVLIIVVSVVAAQFLRYGIEPTSLELLPTDQSVLQINYTTISIVLIAAWVLALRLFDTRSPKVIGIGPSEYKYVIVSTLAVFGSLATLAFLLRSQIGRGYLLIALPIGLALLLLSRWLWRKHLHRVRERRQYTYRTLIVGDRAKSETVAGEIMRSPQAGYDIVGAVTERGTNVELLPGVPVVAGYQDVIQAVDQYEADVLILTSADALTPEHLREIGWELESRDVDMVASIALTGIAGPRLHTRPVSGLPLVHLEVPEFTGRKYFTKRFFDILGSALAIAIISPIALIVSLLIKLDSPGPVMFKQRRVGIGGKPFTMLKFRSMAADAEQRRAELLESNGHNGGLFKMKNDPRITRVGAVLRKYSIDELPQFVNVFRGDMSLVGPRPPLPSEVEEYELWVHRRLLVKPGITGLWQVSGRSDLSWEESIRLDLYYVENWSFVDDLLILFRTVRTVIAPNGAY